MTVEVYCKGCGQRYDHTINLAACDQFNLLRVFNLFNYVPCCSFCKSTNIVVGILNPYRKIAHMSPDEMEAMADREAHQMSVEPMHSLTMSNADVSEALKSGMSVVDINKMRFPKFGVNDK